jgi:hypothetical protein
MYTYYYTGHDKVQNETVYQACSNGVCSVYYYNHVFIRLWRGTTNSDCTPARYKRQSTLDFRYLTLLCDNLKKRMFLQNFFPWHYFGNLLYFFIMSIMKLFGCGIVEWCGWVSKSSNFPTDHQSLSRAFYFTFGHSTDCTCCDFGHLRSFLIRKLALFGVIW